MRCLPIRSVLRAAIAAGLIASCQHATTQASWENYLPTSFGTCYVHDLNWERFQPKPKSFESIAKPADLEADMCLAAAKQFELKMQVDAILDSLKSKSTLVSQFATKAIVGFVQSRRLLVETIKKHDWKVVEIPDSIASVPRVSLPEHDASDFGCDWNCGEWYRDRKPFDAVLLPNRDVANIFVYSLDETPETHVATDSLETIADYSDADYSDIDDSNTDYTNVGDSNVTDSIVTDSNVSDSNVSDSNVSDSNVSDSIVSDSIVSDSIVSDSIVDDAGTAYATLDAENLLSEAERIAWASDSLVSANPWQVGVDPVCPEIHGSSANQSVCCPIESGNEAIATARPTEQLLQTEVQPETQVVVRPPRLDAEFESLDAEPLVPGNSYESFERYAYESSNPWLNSSLASPWNCRLGRRFAFGDNAPRMPQFGRPEGGFSKEDVQVTSRFSSELIGEPNMVPESTHNTSPSSTFSTKDLLTTLHSSTYGSILLPVSKTHRTAVDYAMQLLSKPNSDSRSKASVKLASQLRTVGQFLVNFANQIEDQQVDIARRENNQR